MPDPHIDLPGVRFSVHRKVSVGTPRLGPPSESKSFDFYLDGRDIMGFVEFRSVGKV